MEDQYNFYVQSDATRDNSARWDALVAARRYLKNCTPTDWAWLESSLDDQERKWFVALVFDRESLPRRLLRPMIRAAVYERNASANRSFIDPCLRTFGLDRTKTLVDEFANSADETEAQEAAKLLYWCREPRERRGTW